MKLTKKMTLGMLATAAVVTLPVAAVVSCGGNSKEDDSTKTNTGKNTSSAAGTNTGTSAGDGTNTGTSTGSNTGTNTGKSTGTSTGTNTGTDTSTSKFDFEITSKTTVIEFQQKLASSLSTSTSPETAGVDEPVAKDIIIKIGKDLVKIKKGTTQDGITEKISKELLPKIQVINKTLADGITKLLHEGD
ncbi:hypothetical protein MYMA111404_03130 [Mycoplasma marinum]|uniref:Variable surface lipoprotein n=1 Tax=Mycoplasma marinum TaxID=1937190 RepID=A0A4R0XTT1_9MOLU|nr:hypothetical protein [Mycoplasma marinum]TCG11187.1 hypothetical protein C4B24_02795 [Mycoplasma marinum]